MSAPLARVGWAIAHPDGRLVLGDTKQNIVVVREANGSAHQLGHIGDGPGEYRYPTVGFLRGDSLIVHEVGRLQRVAMHLTTGSGTTRRFTNDGVGRECRVVLLLREEGICERVQLGPRGAGTNVTEAKWFRFQDGESVVRDIQVTHDTSYVARLVHDAGVMHVPRPYHWASRSRVSAGGSTVALLVQHPEGKHVRVRVELWDVATGSSRGMSHLADPIDVPAAAASGLARRMVDELAVHREQLARQREEFSSALRRAWRLPPSAPPFASILASEDRCVWLERTELGWPATSADRIYDRWTFSGDRLPAVALDRDVRILSVTCHDGVGVVEDEDGVPGLTSLHVP
ncbi:MAG: hypothetical protein R3B35_12290 [Gemmatimonadales bacterium]